MDEQVKRLYHHASLGFIPATRGRQIELIPLEIRAELRLAADRIDTLLKQAVDG